MFLFSMLLKREELRAMFFKPKACGVYYGGASRSWSTPPGSALGHKAGQRRTQDQLNRAANCFLTQTITGLRYPIDPGQIQFC